MDTVHDVLNTALAWAQQGFDNVNSIQGLIIALIAAILMTQYRRIFVFAIGATLVHEAINIGRRVLAHAPSRRLFRSLKPAAMPSMRALQAESPSVWFSPNT